jgi:hypothetical protein
MLVRGKRVQIDTMYPQEIAAYKHPTVTWFLGTESKNPDNNC